MPWTNPSTFATGRLVTAADWNTQVRDNMNATLPGVSHTTFAANILASSVNPSLGSTGGVRQGSYRSIRGQVFYQAQVTFTTGFTAGTGNYRITLPVSASTIYDDFEMQVGSGAFLDASANDAYALMPYLTASSTIAILRINSTATQLLTSALPVTPTSGDSITVSLVYFTTV